MKFFTGVFLGIAVLLCSAAAATAVDKPTSALGQKVLSHSNLHKIPIASVLKLLEDKHLSQLVQEVIAMSPLMQSIFTTASSNAGLRVLVKGFYNQPVSMTDVLELATLNSRDPILYLSEVASQKIHQQLAHLSKKSDAPAAFLMLTQHHLTHVDYQSSKYTITSGGVSQKDLQSVMCIFVFLLDNMDHLFNIYEFFNANPINWVSIVIEVMMMDFSSVTPSLTSCQGVYSMSLAGLEHLVETTGKSFPESAPFMNMNVLVQLSSANTVEFMTKWAQIFKAFVNVQ